jgi:hypothetical protein
LNFGLGQVSTSAKSGHPDALPYHAKSASAGMSAILPSVHMVSILFHPGIVKFPLFLLQMFCSLLAVAQPQPVAVTLAVDSGGADLPPRFLGSSFVKLREVTQEPHRYCSFPQSVF